MTNAPSPETDVPRQLGPYRVLKRLAQGGMADVLLATAFGASGFEKQVVLRTLKPSLRGQPRYEKMFLQEAQWCGLLNHPNLVATHDLGVEDGVYYLRMDHVDGHDAAWLLERGVPSTVVALHVASQVALGLRHLHQVKDSGGRPLGLVHRDVSPSNILVSVDGNVLLSDFGIAKATALPELTEAGARKGKYSYMSPEQVDARPLGGASDQFSLGTVLLELLSGGRVFDGASPFETMERIRAVNARWPTLDPDVRTVLERMLAQDATQRFESMDAVVRALQALLWQRGGACALDVTAWHATV
jgi:serine/threonine-protein kinase